MAYRDGRLIGSQLWGRSSYVSTMITTLVIKKHTFYNRYTIHSSDNPTEGINVKSKLPSFFTQKSHSIGLTRL